MAEANRRQSPYVYCRNNPIRFIDPDGMLERPNWGQGGGDGGYMGTGYQSSAFAEKVQHWGEAEIEERDALRERQAAFVGMVEGILNIMDDNTSVNLTRNSDNGWNIAVNITNTQNGEPTDEWKMNNNPGYMFKGWGKSAWDTYWKEKYEHEYTRKSELKQPSYANLRRVKGTPKRDEVESRLLQLSAALGVGGLFEFIKDTYQNVFVTTVVGWAFEDIEVQTSRQQVVVDVVYWYGKIRTKRPLFATESIVAVDVYGYDKQFSVSVMDYIFHQVVHKPSGTIIASSLEAVKNPFSHYTITTYDFMPLKDFGKFD